jgi:glycosyltransferase involved in cell wall biosynthesis
VPASARPTSTVGILHFTCPPIVGGVELLMGQHAELLLEDGHAVRVLSGRGGRFNPRVPVILLPALDSKYPALLTVNEELKAGEVTARFEALVAELLVLLREHLAGLDVCIVHNALSLHFNLPLTVAFARLIAEGRAPLLVAWCHDLSWTNPLYIPLMREREPWSLLKTRLPGVRYVVVSEDRRQDLLKLWDEAPPPVPLPIAMERGSLPASRVLAPPPPLAGEAMGMSAQPIFAPRSGGGPIVGMMDGGWRAVDPVVVPAGVSVRAKLRLRAATIALVHQLGLDDGWPFMLLPARITKRKNIEYAIGVTRALRDLGLAPRLLVTGPPGPHNVRSVDYVDELQAERARLDVRAEVTFLYEERRPDGRFWTATDPMMDDLYQLADLLIFPSSQEGFGIPLLEAGLVRLPVFCSDIPPFREIAGDRVHRFALDAPPAETAARIARFLDTDPATRLRHEVLRRFSWEHVFRERIAPLLVPPSVQPASATVGRDADPPAIPSDRSPESASQRGPAPHLEEPADARRS